MDSLISKFRQKLNNTRLDLVRDFMYQINWGNRFTGIKGARGTGKTTLLLQYIKLNCTDLNKVLYVSLDDLYFRKSNLYNLADQFIKYGGELLVLDEVHRYSAWSEELKLIYDDMPNLKLIFTGSSIIEFTKAKADLSRRAVIYELNGLSFREYLKFTNGNIFDLIKMDDLLKNHVEIALDLLKSIKLLPHFNAYLKNGYYPYFMEGVEFYYNKLAEVINQIIDNDLVSVYNISYATTDKIKSFLMVLAESVPFTPNISKLCNTIGVSRNMITDYLYWLEQARLIMKVHRQGRAISRMQKPEKVLLNNSNLNFVLTGNATNSGTVRETFFVNQLMSNHQVRIPNKGDFIIDDKYIFEIGGLNKDFSQIKDIPDSYLALDGIEIGVGNKIPLWMFGMIY